MGDDFNWLAVSHDVQLFARTHNLTFSSFDRCHERLRDAPSAETVAITCVWYFHKDAADGKKRGGPLRRPFALRSGRAGQAHASRRVTST